MLWRCAACGQIVGAYDPVGRRTVEFATLTVGGCRHEGEWRAVVVRAKIVSEGMST